MTNYTKKMFLEKAEKMGVDIEEEKDEFDRQIWGYTPAGKTWEHSGIHGMVLGAWEANQKLTSKDWRRLILEELVLVDCEDGPECEYCNPQWD
jgi:hypothetical protein